MWFLYIDESGVEQIGAGTDHFVLLGLAIDSASWHWFNIEVEKIKKRYDLQDAEIHTAWMLRKYSEQEQIENFEGLNKTDRIQKTEFNFRKVAGQRSVVGGPADAKKYRRYVNSIKSYIHLSHHQRKAFIVEISRLIAKSPNTKIIAEIISKPDFKPGPRTVYEIAFEQVLSRYDRLLENFRTPGIVIQDNNETVALRLTKLCKEFHNIGTLYRDIKNVVETPLFVNSELTAMIQLADVCSFSIRRFIENGEREIWDIIKSRADKIGDTMVGIRHYTGKRPCNCEICQSHKKKRTTL